MRWKARTSNCARASMSPSWATTAPANRPSCARSPAVEQRTGGKIWFDGKEVNFAGPIEAREAGIETVFQNLALADDLDVPSNLFLGRERVLFQSRAVLDPRSQVHAQGDRSGVDPHGASRFPTSPTRSATCRAASASAWQSPEPRPLRPSSSSWTSRRPRSACRRRRRSKTSSATLKDNGEPLILISHNMRQVFDLVRPHRRLPARPYRRQSAQAGYRRKRCRLLHHRRQDRGGGTCGLE